MNSYNSVIKLNELITQVALINKLEKNNNDLMQECCIELIIISRNFSNATYQTIAISQKSSVFLEWEQSSSNSGRYIV